MSIPPKVGRKINGKSSSETLLGTAFDDTIFGAAGNDIIRGLAGDDVIRGGLGNDTLTGGPGNNIFTFEKTRAENGLDTITDLGYNRAGRDCGGSDILDFSLAITVKKMTQAAIGNYVKVTTDKVFVDLDGTGPAGWVAWANVSGLAVGDKIKVRTAGFNGFVTVGDGAAPVFAEGQTSFSYDENQSAGATVATVTGFTDDVGVTAYRFSNSGGTSGGTTTGDGWFTIGSGGAITMTGSGAASEANDYEAGSGQSHSYYVQARDAAGNWSAPVAITLNEADVDDTAPKVLSVGLTAEDEATYTVLNAGDKVTVTVTMDEDTVIDITGGTPRIALNIGGTAVYANYISGSGGKLLTFEYTLQAGENDADGISIDADSLDANGGTLKDAAGNDADLTHGSVAANADYIVDTTAPVATISGDPQEGASNEAGDLYLVASTETITSLNHILALADDQFNLQTSGGADVKTVLDSNGLADGDYNLYAIDLAGNVSSSSADKLVVLPDPTGGATITSAFNNAPYGEAPSTIEQWMTLLNYTREEVLTNTGVAISLQEPSAGVVGATNTVDYIVVNLGNIQGGVADYEWKIKGVAANSYSNNRATVETSDFKVVWHDETVAASGETVTVTVTGLGAYAGSNYTLDVIFP